MEGEAVGGDEGEVGWPELALELLTEKERESSATLVFREGKCCETERERENRLREMKVEEGADACGDRDEY